MTLLYILTINISGNILTTSVVDKFEKQVTSIAETLYYKVYSEMEKLLGFTQNTEIINSLTNSNYENRSAAFSNVNNWDGQEYVKELYLVDKDGVVKASSIVSSINKDISQEGYIDRLSTGCDVILSDIGLSLTTGQLSMAIGRGIYDHDNNYVGSVIKEFDYNFFADIIRNYVSDGFQPYLTDYYGNIVYSSSEELIGTPLSNDYLHEIALDKELPSDLLYTTYEGEKSLTAYKMMDDLEWKVIAVGKSSLINKPLDNMCSIVLFVSLSMLILSLFSIYILSKNISKPINKSTEKEPIN